MKLYVYTKASQNSTVILGVARTTVANTIDSFAYLLEWFSVAALFFLNSQYIHSRLFSIFVFVVGLVLLLSVDRKKEAVTKQEFLNKIEELTEGME